MKLSKEQIQYIDDYLKYHKFEHWDIRFEVLDHIVKDVESIMKKGVSFDDAMIEVHQSFGNSLNKIWNTGIEHSIFANGNGYKNLIQNKKREINKKYRNLLGLEILNFFKSTKNILILTLLLFLYYQLFKKLDTKLFLKLSVSIALIPPVIAILFQISNWIKGNRSIYLATALFYFMFSFLLYNMVIQLTINDTFFDMPRQTQSIIIFLSLPVYLIGMYCGFKVYYKTHKEYTQIYKELKSI